MTFGPTPGRRSSSSRHALKMCMRACRFERRFGPLMVTVSVPRDDGVGASAVHVPESYLVSQMLMRDVKVLAPLFDVNEPIGRGVRVQPAIGRDAVDDDGVVSEDAEKKLDVLGVESVDVSVDQGLRLAGCRA